MMIDLKSLNLVKSQEIFVYTATNCFQGKFNKISCNGSRLEIKDVRDKDGKPWASFKNFSQKEITRIDFEKSEDHSAPPPTSLTPQQLTVIEESIKTFVLIQQPDRKYFEALEHIAKQYVIGVSANCTRGRVDTTSLLAITTADKIFIFDLPKLNTEKTIGELKAFLEIDTHLKIVYNASNIVDNLSVKLRVDVNPVFDVMLAAAQFYDEKSVIDGGKIVEAVLGVEVQSKKSLDDPHALAVKSAYLLPMYHKLSTKAFPFAFLKVCNSTGSSFEDFFDGLRPNPVKHLKNGVLKEFDMSIYKQ